MTFFSMFYLSLFHQPVGRLRPVMSCQIRTEDKYLTRFQRGNPVGVYSLVLAGVYPAIYFT